MRLSIVVPVLDEAEGIAASLQPLQVLRAQGHEVLVVDGGSRDGTPGFAQPLADRVIASPRGRATQMNAGARIAHGDALLFLHADTRLPDAPPARIEQALRQHAWGRFDVAIEGRSPWLPVIAILMNLRSRLTGIATGDQAIFVTRAAFDAVGGYPEQPLMEDIELSKRLKRIGPPACLRARAVTSGRRWEQHGVWRTILLMWRLRFDYWRGVPAARLAGRYHSGA
jgi:rSAM/selenodomain-associated transferase 2